MMCNGLIWHEIRQWFWNETLLLLLLLLFKQILSILCLLDRDSVLQPASGYHTTPAKPQRNNNTHRTRAIQPMK